MQAGFHWLVLAKEEAERVKLAVDKEDRAYVKVAFEHTGSFGKAFEDLLISSLVAQGVTVMAKEDVSSLVITSNVQVITHKNREYLAPPTGTYTALGAGAYLLSRAVQFWTRPATASLLVSPAMSALPIIFAADLFSGNLAEKSPVEVLITTRAVSDKHVIKMSHSSIYYLNVGDEENYTDKKLPSGTTFRVVNKM
ncbi:MAG: hypothetical protein R8M38_08990 [Mariprofundaceae bacterium]